MQKITPFFRFDGRADEAMNFYTAIFKNSRASNVTRYGKARPGSDGAVKSATFQSEGEDFIALIGGPMFTFSSAISFFVRCETQEGVDEYWENSPRVAKYISAVGSRTNSASLGRSSSRS